MKKPWMRAERFLSKVFAKEKRKRVAKYVLEGRMHSAASELQRNMQQRTGRSRWWDVQRKGDGGWDGKIWWNGAFLWLPIVEDCWNKYEHVGKEKDDKLGSYIRFGFVRESGDSIEGEREKSRDAAKPFCREQIAKLMVIRIFYGSYIYEKVQEGVKMIGFDHRRWRYSVA